MARREPFWEQTYRQGGESTFGRASDEIRDLADQLPSGALALDLGSGDGRNALYLAAHGIRVTAVDISLDGIAKIEAEAWAKGLPVKTRCEDMRHFEFPMAYDLIVAHGCLHLVSRSEWRTLIQRIRAHTAPGGYNVLAVFTNTIEPPEDLKEYCLGLFREGELFDLYRDWEIVLKSSYVLFDEHDGGVSHRHPINKLVARRHC